MTVELAWHFGRIAFRLGRGRYVGHVPPAPHSTSRALLRAAILAGCSAFFASAPAHANSSYLPLPPPAFRVVERESGPVNYYRVVGDKTGSFIAGQYRPGLKTTVLGYQLRDDDRARAKTLRWRWRAVTLPRGADGCSSGRRDSAATVYVTWKRGLRWYTLKYVWTTAGQKGSVCDRKRSPFVAQDTIVTEVGEPLEWKIVSLDLRREYQRAFEGGNPNADVPELQGIGIMTDGDDTNSESQADYAGFELGF